ncbi:MAG: hypothetical protein IDH49_15000 [Gammaproteobacteria bacterium]|nr:hypothetical protein [Gammaproteobacteria bacterium]
MKSDKVGNIPITTIQLNGSAGNAPNVKNNAGQITSGQAQVFQSTHKDDFVGTFIGGNAPTGGISGPDGFVGAHGSYGPNKRDDKSAPYWGSGQKSQSILVTPPANP